MMGEGAFTGAKLIGCCVSLRYSNEYGLEGFSLATSALAAPFAIFAENCVGSGYA